MRITTLALLGIGLTLVACRDGGNGDDAPDNPDGGGTDIDAPSTGETRIQDVQSDSMPVGTVVTLKGVIVTAIDTFGGKTGDFFVQDPDGGPFSGIKVFRAPLDQVAVLAVGDIVDITGAAKEEFALSSDTSGRKVTELKPPDGGGSMTVTKKGTGTVPAPAIVDAVAISAMDKTAREAEWEKWEGVLITVINARQVADQRSFGQAVDQAEFRVTGFARVQSLLAPLPDNNGFGVCYDRITGIGDYFFNDLILPRSTEDLTAGGTNCKPMATTVTALQSGTNTELVDLTNVYVVGRYDASANSKGFWISDALQAAPYGGVLVFTNEVAAPVDYVPGTVVNVRGAVEEYDRTPAMGDTLTEIVSAVHSVVSAATDAPIPVDVEVEVVSNIGAAGEPYEGVLVRVTNVKVTNTNAGQGKVELTDNNGKKLLMDNDAFAWPAQVANTCYASLVGVMSVQVTDDVRTINPRSAADFSTGTGCN